MEDESYLGNLGQPIKLHWEKYRPAMIAVRVDRDDLGATSVSPTP